LRRTPDSLVAQRLPSSEDLDLAYRLYLDGASFGVNRAASAIHYPHPAGSAANGALAADNYRYLAGKYRTPVVDLLVSAGPEINLFTSTR
jgi:hypothetical protein